MLRLKWKLTGTYLVLAGFALFLAGAGLTVETKGQLDTQLVAILLTSLVLTLPLAYFLARNLNNRVDELRRRTKSLVSDMESPKGLLERSDELGELSENVYLLSRRLQSKIREVSRESNKTVAILASMLEGVAVLDHIGRIVMLNRSASTMLSLREDEVKNRYLTDLIRDPGLGENVRSVLDKGEALEHEFAFSGRILRVLMSPVSAAQGVNGAVAVFQDLTEMRNLEQLRTEFVANVSHELRTPLTSIKGFVETLLDGAAEDPRVRERFLNIIYDETRRLQRLIEDLLALSHLEAKRRTEVGITTAAAAYDRVAEVLDKLARAKPVELSVEMSQDLPEVEMGEELLSQVFLNLLENGIKYTSPGGKVWLKVECDGSGIYIEIGDTGPGIPQDSLPRIFERFYRVDRARSREMGGTGLGLSIVKHIVEQVRGRLQVQSEVGEGTVFTVWVPARTCQNNLAEDDGETDDRGEEKTR